MSPTQEWIVELCLIVSNLIKLLVLTDPSFSFILNSLPNSRSHWLLSSIRFERSGLSIGATHSQLSVSGKYTYTGLNRSVLGQFEVSTLNFSCLLVVWAYRWGYSFFVQFVLKWVPDPVNWFLISKWALNRLPSPLPPLFIISSWLQDSSHNAVRCLRCCLGRLGSLAPVI